MFIGFSLHIKIFDVFTSIWPEFDQFLQIRKNYSKLKNWQKK